LASQPLRRNREFMFLWSGQALSAVGSQVSAVAFPLLVLALTGSPAKAGIVGFAAIAPLPLLGMPAGALADRVNRKRLMVACSGVRGLALAALALVLVASGGAPYALIVAVALIDGAGFITSYVAERGALAQIVAPEHLRQAVARNESRSFAAQLAGPPLGGLLFAASRAVPFLFDAVSDIASTVGLLLIRSEFQETRVETEAGGFTDGWRWVWRRPFFRACALLFAGSNPVFTGLVLLIVVLARRHGADPALIGVMLAIAASGGLLGALLAPALQHRLRPRHVVITETWVVVAMLPLLLVVHSALLLGAIVAAAELTTPITNSIVVGYRVALAPDRLQGRVQAASTTISFSFAWLGPLSVGLMLQDAGATATILVLTAWMALLGLATLIAPAFAEPPDSGDPARAPLREANANAG
jgi:MFS family permease